MILFFPLKKMIFIIFHLQKRSPNRYFTCSFLSWEKKSRSFNNFGRLHSYSHYTPRFNFIFCTPRELLWEPHPKIATEGLHKLPIFEITFQGIGKVNKKFESLTFPRLRIRSENMNLEDIFKVLRNTLTNFFLYYLNLGSLLILW